MMYELALFSGAGGGLLASQWLKGWRTVCYVEHNPYRQKTLQARMEEGYLDLAPIWTDVRTFTKRNNNCRRFIRQLRRIRRSLVVTGGFPCQPFSTAGRQMASLDERNMWPDTLRIVREIRPRFLYLENAPTLVTGSHRYFGRILSDLAESGYDARWRVLSAAEVGAPHKRDRSWIVAQCAESRWKKDESALREKVRRVDANGIRQGIPNAHEGRRSAAIQHERSPKRNPASELGSDGTIQFVAYAHKAGDERGQPQQGGIEKSPDVADAYQVGFDKQKDLWQRTAKAERGGWWSTEPDVGRVAHGMASRVDRIEAIGDGQVPLVAATAWDLLMGNE